MCICFRAEVRTNVFVAFEYLSHWLLQEIYYVLILLWQFG